MWFFGRAVFYLLVTAAGFVGGYGVGIFMAPEPEPSSFQEGTLSQQSVSFSQPSVSLSPSGKNSSSDKELSKTPPQDVSPSLLEPPSLESPNLESPKNDKNDHEPDRLTTSSSWENFTVASSFSNEADTPVIAVIIGNMGYDDAISRKVWALSIPVTLAYASDVENLRQQARDAYAKGHEVLLQIPMESRKENENKSPDILWTYHDSDRIEASVHALLDRLDVEIGILTKGGSLFTTDPISMTPVMRVLSEKQILFVDSLTTPDSIGLDLAKHFDVLALQQSSALTQNTQTQPPERENMTKHLVQLEAIAKEKGFAVIVVDSAKEGALAALDSWGQHLSDNNISLVSVSSIARRLGADKANSAGLSH